MNRTNALPIGPQGSLPPPPQPLGAYVTATRHAGLLYLSGMLPVREGKPAFVGHLGGQLTLAAGREAAELAALNALAVARAAAGSLNRIAGVVRLVVYLATDPGFTQHAAVADAASEVVNRWLGTGTGGTGHARLAIGVASLPGGMPVELDLVCSLKEE